MASYKYIRHTAAEIDEAIEQEREHCANEASHTCQEEKDRWNGAAVAVTELSADTFGTPAAKLGRGLDLNSVITPGAYLCPSEPVGKTLINCPVASGFRLEVKNLAAGVDRYVQIIYPNNDTDVMLYVRRLTATGWKSWYKIAGVAVEAIDPAPVE